MKASSLAGKLRRLGSTPKAIAAEFKRRGIKGVDGECSLCPIANFLARTTEGVTRVYVDRCTAEVRLKDGSVTVVHLPKACSKFVDAFDGGLYPKLHCAFSELKTYNPLAV